MTLLKSLILLTLIAVLDAARLNCDYNFYEDAGGYLEFQEMPLKFYDAKQRCALEGGILASPINDGIKAAMMSIMNTSKVNFVEKPFKIPVFTGITKKSNSYGIFTSIEGIRLSGIPHTWAPGEPDNYQDKENCIAMFPDGTMADVKCYKPLPHFCFLKEERAKKLSVCGRKGYTLDTSTGSCYKFHLNELVYDEAAKACKEEGAHLIIINGDTEAKAVKNLFSSAYSLKYPTLAVMESVLSGFRFNNATGQWMTLQGETIEEAGYAKWAPGEPNNASKDEFCGSIDNISDTLNKNMLNDIGCYRELSFICEKDPEILLCK